MYDWHSLPSRAVWSSSVATVADDVHFFRLVYCPSDLSESLVNSVAYALTLKQSGGAIKCCSSTAALIQFVLPPVILRRGVDLTQKKNSSR